MNYQKYNPAIHNRIPGFVMYKPCSKFWEMMNDPSLTVTVKPDQRAIIQVRMIKDYRRFLTKKQERHVSINETVLQWIGKGYAEKYGKTFLIEKEK